MGHRNRNKGKHGKKQRQKKPQNQNTKASNGGKVRTKIKKYRKRATAEDIYAVADSVFGGRYYTINE